MTTKHDEPQSADPERTGAETEPSAHTPLPWSLDWLGNVVDAEGKKVPTTGTVAPLSSQQEFWAEGEANDALIVRAVNSHDALLAACRAQREVMGHWLTCSHCCPGHPCARADVLEQTAGELLLTALVLAEQEPHDG